MGADPPGRNILAHATANFPREMLGYLRIFYKRPPTLEAFRAQAKAFEMSEADMLAALDAAALGKMLITGFDERTSVGLTWVANEPIAVLAGRHPARFIPFAGVDVLAGMDGARVPGLPIKPAVLDQWLNGNAARVLGLAAPGKVA